MRTPKLPGAEQGHQQVEAGPLGRLELALARTVVVARIGRSESRASPWCRSELS